MFYGASRSVNISYTCGGRLVPPPRVKREAIDNARSGPSARRNPPPRKIEHIVSRAARGRGLLRAGEHAYRIIKAYPNCGMSGAEVVNEIIGMAATAGVAVEMSRDPIAA